MPDDWAEKYAEVYNQEQREKQRKEQEDRERRRLAEAGAPEKFHQVRERIKQDLQTLSSAVIFQAMGVQEFSEGRFKVFYPGSPRVELDVEIRVTTIMCTYAYFPPGAAKEPKREPKTLRICSDLDSFITVYRNGGGDSFDDDSEVSEFLLLPLLTHITSQ